MRGKELLTAEQRDEFMRIPSGNDWALGTYYTFSQYDLDVINRHRRDYNRLGFAVQLAVLRFPGWSLSDIKNIPNSVLNYIAEQIGTDPGAFSLYAQREPTRREHLEEIRQAYGFRNFTSREYQSNFRIILNYALENGNADYLLWVSVDELRKQKIILPAMTTLERIVWGARERADKKILWQLTSSLNPEQTEKLDKILSHMPESSKTYLAWLREAPSGCSPDAFLKVAEKLVFLHGLQLQINTKGIHPNRLRQLSKVGARYEPHSFRRFEDPKKNAVLVAYLLDLLQDLTDMAFDTHDRQINLLLSKGRKAQDELQKKNGKSINEKVVIFADLVDALNKAKSEGADLLAAMEAIMPWDQLVSCAEEAKRLMRPIDYDYLDLIEKKFYVLRKYTPTMLKVLKFRSTKAAEPLLKAVDILRDMNETGSRKVPDSAPLDFV